MPFRVRQIRAYGGRPERLEVKVRYQLHLTRKMEAIDIAKQRLGFRLYVTNENQASLSISKAVLAYRQQQYSQNNSSLFLRVIWV